jgi:hypothetical protein
MKHFSLHKYIFHCITACYTVCDKKLLILFLFSLPSNYSFKSYPALYGNRKSKRKIKKLCLHLYVFGFGEMNKLWTLGLLEFFHAAFEK